MVTAFINIVFSISMSILHIPPNTLRIKFMQCLDDALIKSHGGLMGLGMVIFAETLVLFGLCIAAYVRV